MISKESNFLLIFFLSLYIFLPRLLNAEILTNDNQKSSWYIGFGLGAGDIIKIDNEDTFKGYDRGISLPKYVNTYNFGVGAILTPKINVGIDLSGIIRMGNKGELDQESDILNNFIACTYYPFIRGLSFKVGAGYSFMYYEIGGSGGSTGRSELSEKYKGFGVLAGIGYEFWPGTTWAFGLHMEYSRQFYVGGKDAPENSDFWNIYVSSYWY